MKKNAGFTLIEMLIAMLIFGIIGTAITNMYIKNSRVNTAQTQVVNSQLNIRAILDYLNMQICMAGFKNKMPAATPLPNASPVPGITIATEGQFRFTYQDDDTGELRDVDIRLASADDATADGVADSGTASLTIQFDGTGGYQTIAEDIHAVAFAYGFDANHDGAIDTYTVGATTQVLWAMPDPTGGSTNWMRLDSNGDGKIDSNDDTDGNNSLDLVDTGTACNASDIRAVRLFLLGTSGYSDRDYINANSYAVGRHVIAPNDHIRRRLLTVNIFCRNMGI